MTLTRKDFDLMSNVIRKHPIDPALLDDLCGLFKAINPNFKPEVWKKDCLRGKKMKCSNCKSSNLNQLSDPLAEFGMSYYECQDCGIEADYEVD